MRHARMKRPDYDRLFEFASQQGGYFTAAQAHAAGVSGYLLRYHVRRKRYQRVPARRGLYRLRLYPSVPNEHVIEAWLAAGPEAVVSHDSALALHELSDVLPTKVHVTVPRGHRGLATRAGKKGIQVHTATTPLGAKEIVIRQGIKVTTPVRAIVDAAQAGAAPEQVTMAIRQALQRGVITARTLRALAVRSSRRTRALIEQGIRTATAA